VESAIEVSLPGPSAAATYFAQFDPCPKAPCNVTQPALKVVLCRLNQRISDCVSNRFEAGTKITKFVRCTRSSKIPKFINTIFDAYMRQILCSTALKCIFYFSPVKNLEFEVYTFGNELHKVLF
jgi:hypothetical protein